MISFTAIKVIDQILTQKLALMSRTQFAQSKSKTDLPVNCLLRLPLPIDKESSWGAYGSLPVFTPQSNLVLVGCYKHDAATETYSGAVRVIRPSIGSSTPCEGDVVCNVPLPLFGVFDLCLVSVIGGPFSVEAATNNLAPFAAHSKVFATKLASDMMSATKQKFQLPSADNSSVLFVVAAPCTDGHLRLLGIHVANHERLNACNVFVLLDLPVADQMLTSAALFPSVDEDNNKERYSFRAICSSHGGNLHLISAKLSVEVNVADDSATDLSILTCPSPTIISWEGHEYDSWCVARDPLDPAHCFWSGGDDGKLKRWSVSEAQWDAIAQSTSEDNDAEEDEEIIAVKPLQSFAITYDAGVVYIASLHVHSLDQTLSSEQNVASSSHPRLATSSYLLVGSYDENLRIYHLSSSVTPIVADEPLTLPREPLTPSWKALMNTPLFEIPCGGGAWRCRTPPALAFLNAQGTDAMPPLLRNAAGCSEHTNVSDSHIFDAKLSSKIVGSEEDDGKVPLVVAAMQRGGAIVHVPLLRYHRLQSAALTASDCSSAVSSAIPLNMDLIDEFSVDVDDDIIFLEGRQPAGNDDSAPTKHEPLIYDVCPLNMNSTDKSLSLLACSFYDKEIWSF